MEIYHYTDAEALKNIMFNNELWLSHIRFMNDSSELLVGASKAKGWINKYVDKKNEGSSFILEKPDYRNTESDAVLSSRNIMVSSFCKAKDLLSQWVTYGNYALGFDFQMMAKLINEGYFFNIDNTFNAFMSECSYSDESLKEWIMNNPRKIIDKAFREKRQFSEDETHLIDRFAEIAGIQYKHNGFEAEHELRLSIHCHMLSDKVQYRVKDGVLMPYIKVPIPEGCLKSVLVGPQRNQQRAYDGMKRIVRDLNVNKNRSIKVSKSDIPYIG